MLSLLSVLLLASRLAEGTAGAAATEATNAGLADRLKARSAANARCVTHCLQQSIEDCSTVHSGGQVRSPKVTKGNYADLNVSCLLCAACTAKQLNLLVHLGCFVEAWNGLAAWRLQACWQHTRLGVMFALCNTTDCRTVNLVADWAEVKSTTASGRIRCDRNRCPETVWDTKCLYSRCNTLHLT